MLPLVKKGGWGGEAFLATESSEGKSESVCRGRPLCMARQAKAVVAACNMAGLFSAFFLVAVTKHAGSSHVIIEGGEKHGNPWQLMQGMNHVRRGTAEDSAGGSLSIAHVRDVSPGSF